MAGYSTKEVADLVDLPRQTIWELARAGVLDPEKTQSLQYRFSFQDIVILRTAKDLIEDGVRKSRIQHALSQLKSQLPTNRPLTSLRISGDGNAVVIREENRLFNAESGQLHLNFELTEGSSVISNFTQVAESDTEEQLTSDDWFDLGVDLEAVSPDDAPAAYRRALEIDPSHGDAHVNLGRILQERGDFKEAEHHYRLALQLDEDNVLATFNLGTLLEDVGRIEEAIDAYKNAVQFADAHYNLSRLYELIGEHDLALSHLKKYRKLIDPD
ncbi:MAG: tetratricopeptide repeat protein [Gammaproteobacteria bacterium]|nr:tetratricopeptide repeat protein [Gammaproteobacteria bacterium]MBT6244356.1 tetratricopeptide repeat protein [Gammaproteobacteria bacterium]